MSATVVRRRGSKPVSTKSIPGARPASPPGFVEPCLPTLREHAPAGDQWVHEIKFDGYRLQLHVRDGRAVVFTRRDYDRTRRFPPLVGAARALPAHTAVLDGELIVPGERGISDYAKLQDDIAAGRSDRFLYYAFDLLYLDGMDLRSAALIERKQALQKLLSSAPPPIVYSEHLESEAEATQRRACAMGLEGLVSKRRDAPYRSGRQETWIKVKCIKSDTFPIIASSRSSGRSRAASPRSMSDAATAISCSTSASCAAATCTRARGHCAKS